MNLVDIYLNTICKQYWTYVFMITIITESRITDKTAHLQKITKQRETSFITTTGFRTCFQFTQYLCLFASKVISQHLTFSTFYHTLQWHVLIFVLSIHNNYKCKRMFLTLLIYITLLPNMSLYN